MSIPGIRCADRFRSRDDVMARARRVAHGLAGLGVGPGERVAIVLRNEIENVEVTLGVAQAGAVPVSVNWHLKEQELAYVLHDSEAVLVFAHADLAGVVRAALDGTPVPVVEVPTTPALRAAYGAADSTGGHDFETWLAAQEDREPASSVPQLGLLYSSGTTGTPKGILREPATAEQSELLGARILRAFGLEPGTSTLVPAPLYHAAPNAHALFGLAAGCEVVIMPRFSAAEFLRIVEQRAIVHAQVVPTMFVRMLALPDSERLAHDVSSLRCVVHAAGPCAPEVKLAMIDWWGPILQEYYGGTEVGTVVACDSHEWLAHPGTVGRAMDGCDIRIVAPGGTECATGTAGEIFADPGAAWPGSRYVGAAAGTGLRRRGGHISIGDGGWLDADGYLYLSDRIADMVISGGVNIYPVEIEHCVIGLPGVRDAAAFGVPDPVHGERLVLHVDTDLTAEDVLAHLRERLAAYKVPRAVVIDHDLPREESGKLFKRRIRDRYR